jgi:hypothetical protein
MRPIDYRNETFEMVRDRGLICERLNVYHAFLHHGPGTTREIARRSGIDILNLRPRATELYQLGFLKLLESEDDTLRGSEGMYRALTMEEAHAKFLADKVREKLAMQSELQLGT